MPQEGWNAPGLHYIDDPNTRTSFQDLRDYLGPYSIQRNRTSNTANKAAGAEFKIEFNATVQNTGDKFKVSTDGFGIIIPWQGLYRVELSHALAVVVGTSTNIMTYINISVWQYDEATVRRTSAYHKQLINPVGEPTPIISTSDTVPARAGDRIYGKAYWQNVTGAATSAATFGAGGADYYTNMTVTYVGKT